MIYLIISFLVVVAPDKYITRPVFQDGIPPCYLVDYSTGFGGRKLMGSIASVVLGNYVTKRELFCFISTGYAFLILLFSFLIGKFLKKVKSSQPKDIYWGCLYLVLLYLSSPFSIAYLFNWQNFGRMEIWQLIILVIFILAYSSINKYIRPLWSLLCIIVSILIHPVFLSTYFPFYGLMMIYDVYNNCGREKKYIVFEYFISLCIVFLFMIWIQFYPSPNMTLEELTLYLQNKTNIELDVFYVKFLFLAKLSDHIREVVIGYIPRTVSGIVLAFILFSPFFYIIYNILKDYYYYLRKNRVQLFLVVASLSPMIIAYITAVDFGRWLAADINCLLLFSSYLIYNNKKSALSPIPKLYYSIRRHPYIYLFILLYLDCFGKVGFRFQPIITFAADNISELFYLMI